ncbi:MAG: c-type cytochrome [Nitrospinae bacterium]|nr:c-type cytochrome [Nitrospinota bacterium]
MRYISGLLVFAFVAVTGFLAVADNVVKPDTIIEGKALFMSEKYKCFTCHGEKGEGGKGPSFIGVGKKLSNAEMMKKAAHNCPPTGACSPKDLSAIVDFLRTL